jgi:hypothetical protein
MSSFIQREEYSFKGGEHSFRGNSLLELHVINLLQASLFSASYMLLMSSFSVLDFKGG